MVPPQPTRRRRSSQRLAERQVDQTNTKSEQPASITPPTQSDCKGSSSTTRVKNIKSESESLGVPPPPDGIIRQCDLRGNELIGREILICWKDKLWYDAMVVNYYEEADEYKLVYRADDGVEILDLNQHRWTIVSKKSPLYNPYIIDGSIINFTYPGDGLVYSAMIYDSSSDGKRVKIAYIDEHTTDMLKGGGWCFIKHSPCIETSDVAQNKNDITQILYQDSINCIRTGNYLTDTAKQKQEEIEKRQGEYQDMIDHKLCQDELDGNIVARRHEYDSMLDAQFNGDLRQASRSGK